MPGRMSKRILVAMYVILSIAPTFLTVVKILTWRLSANSNAGDIIEPSVTYKGLYAFFATFSLFAMTVLAISKNYLMRSVSLSICVIGWVVLIMAYGSWTGVLATALRERGRCILDNVVTFIAVVDASCCTYVALLVASRTKISFPKKS